MTAQVRLRDPITGSIVVVDEASAAVLADSGYKSVEGHGTKAPRKTAASRKSDN